MSTRAGPPWAAAGASVEAMAVDGDGLPNRWAATSAISATSAIAATAHGRADPSPRSTGRARRDSDAVAVAGVPQRWQNLAPGVSGVWQAAHCAPASGAPQLEQ